MRNSVTLILSLLLSAISFAQDSLLIQLTGKNIPIPGAEVHYEMIYGFKGQSATAQANVMFHKDPSLTLVLASPNPTRIGGDTLFWENLSMENNHGYFIDLTFSLPSTKQPGETLVNSAILYNSNSSSFVYGSDHLTQTLQGAVVSDNKPSFNNFEGIKWVKEVRNLQYYAHSSTVIDSLPNGDVVIAGVGEGQNLFIQRVSKDGSVIRATQHAGFEIHSVESMKLIGNHTAIIAGRRSYNTPQNFTNSFGWVCSVSLQTGLPLWRKYVMVDTTTAIGRRATSYVNSIAIGSDNSIYAAGTEFYELHNPNGSLTDSIAGRLIKMGISEGTTIWDKSFGEGNLWTEVTDATISNDGNILIGGLRVHAAQTIQRNGFIYKIDPATGNLLWKQDTIGGEKHGELNKILNVDDGYVLAGSASVDPDAYADAAMMWIRKIDFDGNVVWEKKYDLQMNATLFTIKKDGDGFVALGTVENNSAKTVLYKFDEDGDLLGKKGFTLDPLLRESDLLPVGNNEYLITARLDGSLNGKDVLSGASRRGVLLKFGFQNVVTGTVFVDRNGNGIKDFGENYVSNVLVTSEKGSGKQSSYTTNGWFANLVTEGNYVTSVQIDTLNYMVTPSADTVVFSDFFSRDTVHFALQPITDKKDLKISIVPITPARPGFLSEYEIKVTNASAEDITAIMVKTVKDSLQAFENNSNQHQINGDTLTWQVNTLAGLESKSITVVMRNSIPPALNNGDTLKIKALLESPEQDYTPEDNKCTLVQIVQGSFDPNDKTEMNNGVYTPEQLSRKEYLQYVIRFQNTGTDTAFRIVVKDTLDSKLNWNSFELLSASHPFQMNIKEGNKVDWVFDNILLPHSGINEPASHGYIVYRIRPNNNLVLGETIHNTASIYFDFNLPIVTNDAFTTYTNNLQVLPFSLLHFGAVQNSKNVDVSWKVQDDADIDHYEVEKSTDGIRFKVLSTVRSYQTPSTSKYSLKDELGSETVIYYRLKIVHKTGKITYSDIVVIKTKVLQSAIYPNPVTSIDPSISITINSNSELKVFVYNVSGQLLLTQRHMLKKGHNQILVNRFTTLANGVYTVKLESGLGTSVHKLTLTRN